MKGVNELRGRGLALALALLALALAGCASYEHKPHREDASQVETPDYVLRFVESDDEGWFWNRKRADEAIDLVERSARQMDTFVLVFVHGWHHSARCCDGNVEGFKATLTELRKELSQPMYANARSGLRSNLKVSSEFRIVGIYMGWRGRSLPGLLDYGTFWGRKSAAERVGENDMREFFVRLDQVYRTHQKSREHATFLGLVTLGHSFGGQAVLRSVSAIFEQQLEHLSRAPGYLRDSSPTSPPKEQQEQFHGLGDLVILVNPAVEASAYQRINALGRGITYPDSQTPVLVTFSADNDKPRHTLFRLGRIAGEYLGGKPRKKDRVEKTMERNALGFYGEVGDQVTHRLKPVDPDDRLVARTLEHKPEAACSQGGRKEECSCEWYEWKENLARKSQPDTLPAEVATADELGALLPRVKQYDFAQRTVFDDVELVPLAGATPFQPTFVATVSEELIEGHNGVFSGPFLRFLASYIGFIEAKQYLLTAEKKWR